MSGKGRSYKIVNYNFTQLYSFVPWVFNNWFNPAMSDKTLPIKRLQDYRLEDLFMNLSILQSLNLRIGLARRDLPTSCRFNSIRRLQITDSKIAESFNLPIFQSSNRTGAMDQTKILPKQNSSEQRAASNEGFSSSLNSHYSLLATKLTGGKNE